MRTASHLNLWQITRVLTVFPIQAGEALNRKPSVGLKVGFWTQLFSLMLSASFAAAQTNAPSGSYIRSYVNDLPDRPLVTVVVTDLAGVTCFTVEEALPGTAAASDVSGDGVWLPDLHVIRWGPYFNLSGTNVSYRLSGMPASHRVSGGAWLDGQWHLAPGETWVGVLPTSSTGAVLSPPPQVAFPALDPASGSNVPVSLSITDATPGAVIYYTLDGSLPTAASTLYTGAVYLVSASVVRARAITNGWTPSGTAVAYYGPPAAAADAWLSRSLDLNSQTVAFNVTPGTNASCFTLTESLPPGIGALNVSAGGNYIASNHVVLWGPFLGTNAQALSYQFTGLPGTYPVMATWSVDGVAGGETTSTNLVIALAAGNLIPTPAPQVAFPALNPATGGNVPVSLSITDATPGAVIYYTLDGSLPTAASTLYTGAVYLVSASVVRARAITNGWTPSGTAVAYYGPPAAAADAWLSRSLDLNSQTVAFNVTPGTNASCFTLTESLPPGIGALNVSAGGNYIASNHVVLWGPFLGTNAQVLSYQFTGLPGTYPVTATWSVDGIGNRETSGATLVIPNGGGGLIPTPLLREPMPALTPAIASNLPVTVSIVSSDPQAEVHYTTDGTLPTQSSTSYTVPLTFATRTSLRARAFHTGYQPSLAVVGEYVPVLTTNTILLGQTISGGGSFLPTVNLAALPQGTVNCYAVVETIPFGLTPSALSNDGIWDPLARLIRWGPYLDHQPRTFSFNVGGLTGTYPLSGQVSYDGYSLATTNAVSAQVNNSYSGSDPVTNLVACSMDYLTYNLDIDPSPGVITVTSVTGSVDWGDGTRSPITQPVMTLEKSYGTNGTYPIAIAANWTGYTTALAVSGVATRTDLVQVVTSCLAPEIVTQPSDQVALLGSVAQFAVSAVSSVPMTYQWFLNTNTPLFSSSDFATLTLPNVTPQSAGVYSVIITNAFGSVTSSVAALTVVTPLVNNIARGMNGGVALGFVGLPNITTRIWATTNLASPADWQPIFTNTATSTNGTWQFTDTNIIQYPGRFYRFSTP